MCSALFAMNDENTESHQKKAALLLLSKATSFLVPPKDNKGSKSPLMRCKLVIIEPEKLDDDMIQKVKKFQERIQRSIIKVKH